LEAQSVDRPVTSSTRRGRGRRRQPVAPAVQGELTNRPTLALGNALAVGPPAEPPQDHLGQSDQRGESPAAAAPVRVKRPRTGRLAGLTTGVESPPLPEMTDIETNRADLWATGLSPTHYPTEFLRSGLAEQGVITAAGLSEVADRDRVTVAGIVTHRQRPATAQGTIFINLEDETGLINVICSAGAWARYRRVARSEPALLIRGTVEKVEGVINVVAEHIQPLRLATATAGAPIKSRDFR
jgi:error-prone DNA polymerase